MTEINEVMEQNVETLVDGNDAETMKVTSNGLLDVIVEHPIASATIGGVAVAAGLAWKNRKKILAGFKQAATGFKDGYNNYVVDEKADRKKKLKKAKKIAAKSKKTEDDSDDNIIDVDFKEETEE